LKKLLWIGIGLGALFCATFVVGMLTGFFDEQSVRAALTDLSDRPGASWWIGGAIVGLLTIDLALAVPSSVVMVVGGNLLGWWWGGVAAAVGGMLLAFVGYGLCYLGGRPVYRRLVTPGEQMRIRRWFDNYGLIAIVIARGLPIVPEVIVCLAGLTRLPPGRFLGTFALATVPFAFLHSLAGRYSTIAQPWPALLVIVGIPALSWTSWRITRRRRRPTGDAQT